MSENVDKEASAAWTLYQQSSKSAGVPDMLSMVDTQSGPGKFKIPSGNDEKTLRSALKGDELTENLKLRWKAHVNYTQIGHQMLVAVNPLDMPQRQQAKDKELRKAAKKLEKDGKVAAVVNFDEDSYQMLLEQEQQLLLKDPQSNIAVQDGSAAHVFSFATRCYNHMMRERENQVIVMNGDSGSGKSYNVRMVIRQLSHLSANRKQQKQSGNKITQRLMSSLQLIDIFSCAKTHFSGDSSRVHKFIELQFGKSGKLLGAKILDFLLEKSRIVQWQSFALGEQNFHVFYQLFGADMFSKTDRDRLSLLDSAKNYRYLLPQNSNYHLPKVNAFESVSKQLNIKNVMRHCGFGSRTQDEIYKLLSCIILLGNIDFAEVASHKADGAYVKTADVLQKCAALLGVSPESLSTTITQRTTTIGTTLCASFLTVEQSSKFRDKLAITLFTLLFQYIVVTLNGRLNLQSKTTQKAMWQNCIGIIDFAGFEDFSCIFGDNKGTGNKFWQFAANFADQTLLQIIHEHSFDFANEAKAATEPSAVHEGLAQCEYLATSQLVESTALFNGGTGGLFSILDEETLRCGELQEQEPFELAELFVRANIVQSKRQGIALFNQAAVANPEAPGSKYFIPGTSKKTFGVKHYGGFSSSSHGNSNENYIKVIYDTSDFLVCNNLGGSEQTSLSNDHVRLIQGTADFPACKNKLLLSIVEQLVQKPSQLTNVTGTVKSSSTKNNSQSQKRVSMLDRMPSIRVLGQDEKRLSQVVLDRIVQDTQNGEAPDTPLSRLEKIEAQTQISGFAVDVSKLYTVLQSEFSSKWWTVFCLKINDEFSAKKFVDERVRSQLRHVDIPLMVAKSVGSYSAKLTWQSFQSRYFVLANKPEITQKLKVFGVQPQSIQHSQALCKAIYELYAIITGGGNGRVAITDTHLYLNERAWWALERNLSFVEIANRSNRLTQQGLSEVISDEDSVVTDFSSGQNDDLDSSEDIQAINIERQKLEMARHKTEISPQRWRWLLLVTSLTWWIPTFLIKHVGGMKNIDVIQAWREKVALNILIGVMSTIMLFLIVGYGNVLCPPQNVFSVPDMQLAQSDKGRLLMSVKGLVYDVTNFPHGNRRDFMLTFASQDVSRFFLQSGGCSEYVSQKNARSGINRRGVIPSSPDDPQSTPPPTTANNLIGNMTLCPKDPTQCHFGKNEPSGILNRLQSGQFSSSQITLAGRYVVSWNEISQHGSSSSSQWVVINGQVYDITIPVSSGFFDSTFSQVLTTAAGRDASILPNISPAEYQCLQDRYYIGSLDNRNSVECQAAAYSLMGLTVIVCSVMLVKFLSALQLGATRIPEDIERYCIIQIPCYTENEESLKKTIDSVVLTEYSDMHKLLFIIADGFVKGSGNARMTPELVLQILGVDNASEKLMNDAQVPRFEYIALGEGQNRLNMAKVFTGYYETMAHRVPYIVVAKCGKLSETRKPGNRGKRDSQLIMMKFLNKVYNERPMQPLEVEMYQQLTQVLGLNPKLYEYSLLVDADTSVIADSIVRLIAVMVNDSLVMGVCGETHISNSMDSWVTMIQMYDYYISHHLSKAFESLFGSVTCLPGCFALYRLRSPGKKSSPILVDDKIIEEYEDNNIDTLHKKNLLSLGEDRFLTTLMLKNFPNLRNKFTFDAACQTVVPADYWVLLSQRRRWINSTVHNLWELVQIPQLCGCLCFSMRLVVFLDLVATLTMPASILYLVYLSYITFQSGKVDTIAQSLYLFAAVYAMQMIIFIIKRRWEMIGWMIIYIISLPVYGFFLPIYAFWHFDDFSWGNTRVVVGDTSGTQGHAAAGEGEQAFDETKVSLVDFDKVVSGTAARTAFPLQQQPMDQRLQSIWNGQMPYSIYGYPVQYGNPLTASLKSASQYGVSQPGSAVEYAPQLMQYNPYGVPVTFYQPQQPGSVGPVPPPRLTIDTERVQVKPLERFDGFLKSVLPLPDQLDKKLALHIFELVEQMLKVEDLKSLTKKNVRERVQNQLRNESEDGTEVVDLIAAPLKEWFNLVVTELLIDQARTKMMA